MSAVYFFNEELPSAARNGERYSASICEIDQRVRVRVGDTEVELDEAAALKFMTAFADAIKRAW